MTGILLALPDRFKTDIEVTLLSAQSHGDGERAEYRVRVKDAVVDHA
jgi:hypothetical protein